MRNLLAARLAARAWRGKSACEEIRLRSLRGSRFRAGFAIWHAPEMPVPLDQLLLFLGGSILITIVPGPDMALVFRQVLLGGTRLAQRTIYGNLSGLVVHAVALAAGLSALLAASAEAYTVVKLAGAVYLVYLGVQTLRSSRHAPDDAAAEDRTIAARPIPSMRAAYVQGLVSTVLNPKPALLFLTYLPQFVDTARAVLPQIAFLAAVHILVGLVWMTFYAHLVRRAQRTLRRPDIRRWLERVTGVVLVGLGLRVALERR
jgi:threonine/homoserine/homoserine lactone efflux protein